MRRVWRRCRGREICGPGLARCGRTMTADLSFTRGLPSVHVTFQPRANNAEQNGCDVWIMVGEMDAIYE